MNDQSILTSIKTMLGDTESSSPFDMQIIAHINSTFGILEQLGVGPVGGFAISDDTAKWSDYTTGNIKLEMVVSYVYLQTKLLFDPPQNSSLLAAMQQSAKEFECRLNYAVDN